MIHGTAVAALTRHPAPQQMHYARVVRGPNLFNPTHQMTNPTHNPTDPIKTTTNLLVQESQLSAHNVT